MCSNLINNIFLDLCKSPLSGKGLPLIIEKVQYLSLTILHIHVKTYHQIVTFIIAKSPGLCLFQYRTKSNSYNQISSCKHWQSCSSCLKPARTECSVATLREAEAPKKSDVSCKSTLGCGRRQNYIFCIWLGKGISEICFKVIWFF